MITLEYLHERLIDAGLGAYIGTLLALAQPAIHLTPILTLVQSHEVGLSRLGGLPDVPADFEWGLYDDFPLTFIGQINLRDCAPYDVSQRLPKTGLLLFFYAGISMPTGCDPHHQAGFSILYIPETTPLIHASAPSHPDLQILNPCSLQFRTEWTLRTSEGGFHHQMGWTDETATVYDRVLVELEQMTRPLHRLLGNPDAVQIFDMATDANYVTSGFTLKHHSGHKLAIESAVPDHPWSLLLQVDSDPEHLGIMWGDLGRIYFWIRDDHLQASHFAQSWVFYQCS